MTSTTAIDSIPELIIREYLYGGLQRTTMFFREFYKAVPDSQIVCNLTLIFLYSSVS